MKANKRGTTTLFLAIILSALILVETTYIAYVADLDRRLTYTRALKEQTEIYLSSYDRQLFRTYGIYAFDSSSLDSTVFNSILEANGYDRGDVLYVSGMYSIDTEVIRRSVALYYSYRASGIVFQRFSRVIMPLLIQLDEYGVLDKLNDFLSSPAAGTISRILDGGEQIVGVISSVCDTLGIDTSSFIDLFSGLGAIRNNSVDIGNGFDPSDLRFILDLIDFNQGLNETVAQFNSNPVSMHICLADYAGNNFDTVMNDDVSINGTSFDSFHEDNRSDTEYILTGLEGLAGCALTDFYIFGVLFLRSLIVNLTDPGKADMIMALSDVLCAVISVLTEGIVTLPPEVYRVIITLLISEIDAMTDLISVLRGERITFIDTGSADVLSMGYRDFLSVFMFLVPDDLILTRIQNVLDTDFPSYITAIDVKTDYANTTLSYEGCYEIYR